MITEKIFIGGLPPNKNLKKSLLDYFSKYGKIASICIKIQKRDFEYTKRFAFITFKSKKNTINVLKDYKIHKINQKWIEVKPYYKFNDKSPKVYKPLKRSNSQISNIITLNSLLKEESNIFFYNKKQLQNVNIQNDSYFFTLEIKNQLYNNIIKRLVKKN